ncbi:molecular chaperone TorD family protein [Aurantimonas sp. A2-1-M11]|uniref:TorD/DmsD family molecular chaperone n=1 Tax=Aurantimonas sp. A2-1-M11 TaxID=3113712 RepID=UPI002F93DADE
MQTNNLAVTTEPAEAEALRANLYRLLARILAQPMDESLLLTLRGLSGDSSLLGQGIGELAAQAAATSLAEAHAEYQELFIGVGRGELVPYGSYYLTGFLHEKPLARLRSDMVPLGIARSDDSRDPEDHAGALMEMMAGLIDGAFGQVQPLAVQKDFFRKHVGSWAGHFFADLETSRSALLYRPVGTVGRHFMAIEESGFDM